MPSRLQPRGAPAGAAHSHEMRKSRLQVPRTPLDLGQLQLLLPRVPLFALRYESKYDLSPVLAGTGLPAAWGVLCAETAARRGTASAEDLEEVRERKPLRRQQRGRPRDRSGDALRIIVLL